MTARFTRSASSIRVLYFVRMTSSTVKVACRSSMSSASCGRSASEPRSNDRGYFAISIGSRIDTNCGGLLAF
jgi:hypothetical protein